MSVILRAENISKQYRLGLVGTGTISHDLNRWWHKVRGKDDPFLKIGEVNDRSTKGESDYVWALKDINFEVKRGEVLGVIGKNGAGKSTLLKILSRVTSPTTGEIKTKGRIASLLEVGTGFHPEMTGRENIYLNGAILGMTKAEIRSKIDEIIDFSGCERYIDTPVKRYSSGMTVRLAFAVAAHLEPDILVVDEVLAVGDAEFQKKAIGKMQDISKGDGRTVLFVSHNMGSLQRICTRALLLENGELVYEGSVENTIEKYIKHGERNSKTLINNDLNLPLCVTGAELISDSKGVIDVEDDIKFKITYKVNKADCENSIAIRLVRNGTILFTDFVKINDEYCLDKQLGSFQVISKNFPKRLLKSGSYSVDIHVGIIKKQVIQRVDGVLDFDVELSSKHGYNSSFSKDRPGVIGVNIDWDLML
ncbi:ABC transporter ATP-binding protein [Winogradskyella sp. KYW1333]|uniref:ABC transporter ATP-binding protein n=1 Tax=Winogradskyella sp. KYW1333 TaxID=2282123 RepID=UPI000DF1A12B|nr:ABC transporter ATP-binding protein [Winogradskyella sp. KYW1333]RCT54788.1 ATP-binding cassette domain-containing protein [Winogradskyella sp. KYW1333]